MKFVYQNISKYIKRWFILQLIIQLCYNCVIHFWSGMAWWAHFSNRTNPEMNLMCSKHTTMRYRKLPSRCHLTAFYRESSPGEISRLWLWLLYSIVPLHTPPDLLFIGNFRSAKSNESWFYWPGMKFFTWFINVFKIASTAKWEHTYIVFITWLTVLFPHFLGN